VRTPERQACSGSSAWRKLTQGQGTRLSARIVDDTASRLLPCTRAWAQGCR
jgi:hypothetical protein